MSKRDASKLKALLPTLQAMAAQAESLQEQFTSVYEPAAERYGNRTERYLESEQGQQDTEDLGDMDEVEFTLQDFPETINAMIEKIQSICDRNGITY